MTGATATLTPAAAVEAVNALYEWGVANANAKRERRRLVVAAWRAGERRVAELARCAGVSRDTIYVDLRSAGITRITRTIDSTKDTP